MCPKGDGKSSQSPGEMKVDNSQLGKKWGKHKTDYPELKSHTEYKGLADDIFKNPEKVIHDEAQKEYYYIRGNDLLRVDEGGNFVSLYPGASSGRVTIVD